MVAATGALSTAERSYPTTKVRGRSWEDPMPKGRQPRGVTPHLRSGAAAESDRLQRCRNGREERPTAKSYPSPRSGAVAGRSYPMPEAGGGGWEDQPQVQGEWLRGPRRA